jgi:ribosomal protein L16 Arg81 hydroxylase
MTTNSIIRPFEELIGPGTVERLSAVWGREPLLVPAAFDRFQELLDEDRLRSALATGRPRTAALDPADPDEPLTAGSTRPVPPEQIDAEIAAGRTICVTDLSAGDADLAELARTVRSALGVPGAVRVNAFLSPPGSGAELHIDARVTMSLQVSGAKEWWYGAAPAVPWPRSNAQLLPSGEPVWMYPWCGVEPWERLEPVSRTDLQHVVLRPGDLLCLPAGTWHAARAVDRSLAINVSMSPADSARELAELIDPLLRSDPLWRGGLALAPTGSGEAGRNDLHRRNDLRRLKQLALRALAETEP